MGSCLSSTCRLAVVFHVEEVTIPVGYSASIVKTFKATIRALSKILGGIAVLVLFFAPVTNGGMALMLGSVVVGVICVGAYAWSEPDDDDPLPATKDSK